MEGFCCFLSGYLKVRLIIVKLYEIESHCCRVVEGYICLFYSFLFYYPERIYVLLLCIMVPDLLMLLSLLP